MAKPKMISLKFTSPVISGDCIMLASKSLRYLRALKKANKKYGEVKIEIKRIDG